MPDTEPRFRTRTAVAPPDRLADSATRPIVRHLAVVGAGAERFPGPHTVERVAGAPHTIVCLCTSGVGWVTLDGVTHEAGPGTVFVLPADVRHGYGAREPLWTIWWVTVLGSEVPEFVRAMGADRTTPVVTVRDTERVIAGVGDVLRALESAGSPAQELETTAAAWRLLTALAVDRLRPGRGDPLERAMQRIAEHPEREIRVADLASAVGVSSSRLHALFKEATGGGVIGYQIGLRMAAARRLLDDSTAPVSEIARDLGYRDPYYFSRRFHRVHGVSPTEFRRRARP
jgi:AraC-like DNA-binding protein